jgi:excinuclease ABC subunit C
MRCAAGKIIYIGKAKDIRRRLTSYFTKHNSIKTETLMRNVASIETIITMSEYEALILENTLIKQHTPRYNINLKDGKTYPVIRITAEKYPKVFRTRRIVNDGSRYFGPFPQIHSIDTLLKLAEKLYPLRKCKIFRRRQSPCLYYHIKRCSAPCAEKISPLDYKKHIDELASILAGGEVRIEKIIATFTQKMQSASSKLEFEKAGEYRNSIEAIKEIFNENVTGDLDINDRDYIAWAIRGILCTYSVIQVRSGKIQNRDIFRSKSASINDETLSTFLLSYYSVDRPPPPVVFLQRGSTKTEKALPESARTEAADDAAPPRSIAVSASSPNPTGSSAAGLFRSPHFEYTANLSRYFQEKFNKIPEFCFPLAKKDQSLMAMAHLNAKEDLHKRVKDHGVSIYLDDLQIKLGLKRRPKHIEGFDIAQLEGKHPVSSLIVFKNGIPDKRSYRYFKLKSVIGIVDDFASMREVVRRRYSRLLRENAELPDMILVDGGLGQVNAAKGVLDELGIEIDIAGLAKRDEEIWLPSAALADGETNPIRLPRDNDGLKILQHVRDETHRFATNFNQSLRSKDISLSVLESIDGIGKTRARRIIQEFITLGAIAKTQAQEIAERVNINLPLARTLRAAVALALEDAAANLPRRKK